MLSMQDLADVIELAVLGSRTQRDKRFLEDIVRKLNESQSENPPSESDEINEVDKSNEV